jgi:Protein of unknown function (DUF499)
MAKLKPWYQVVTPREDLRENRPLDASEFAVHLDHIRDKRAHDDYVKPERFFERTYLTKSLLDLSAQVLRRLSGVKVETSAVFNMATQFGGGKTHALTALYHLAQGGEAAKGWKGVNAILSQGGTATVPKARVAVFVGTEFDVVEGRGGEGEPQRKTPWGEIAWQLGRERSFEAVAKHDRDGIAPGGDVIRRMLPDGPSLILMDELLNYVSRARRMGLSDQLYNLLQNLAEEARARENLVLCVSIPASELEMNPTDQRDYDSFKKLLDRLGKAISMSTEGEVAEIIRRRLFEWGGLPAEGRTAVAAYAEWAGDHASEVANISPETAVGVFGGTYPFHPSVISVFERKWQGLPRFQRTRGVLRLLALWVSRAYADGYGKATGEPLIQLGSAPLQDQIFRDAVFEQLGSDQLIVPVTTDIAGKPESHAVRLDKEATESIRKARLHQKVATTIFFESNGGQSQSKAEATLPEIRTAVGGPEVNLAEIETALEALIATCFYLVSDRNKYRFGLRPNLNHMLVVSRGAVRTKDIDDRLGQEIVELFKDGAKGVDRRFPQRSNDVPDRAQLCLAVLGLDALASEAATPRLIEEILRNAGTSGRTHKSGLLFAAADSSGAASEAARTLLAWEDINDDEDAKSRLDDAQRSTLDRSLKRARADLRESLFRSYRHVFLLDRDNTVKNIDLGQITSSSVEGGRLADLIVRELVKLDEIAGSIGPSKLVRFWPPAFTEWSTKDVRNAFFASPSLPRLLNPESIKRTIADGVSQKLLGYARRDAHGRVRLERFGESLSETEVEISDEVCILRAEDAQKLVEPPRLAKLAVEPAHVEVVPRAQVVFKVTGLDQYDQACPLSGIEWTAPGCTINSAGLMTTAETPGVYRVTARADGLQADAEVIVAVRAKGPTSVGGKARLIRWSGAVPPQKWMNFYTKVLARFIGSPGLALTVTFEVQADADQAKGKVEETRQALKELGLSDSVESGE